MTRSNTRIEFLVSVARKRGFRTLLIAAATLLVALAGSPAGADIIAGNSADARIETHTYYPVPNVTDVGSWGIGVGEFYAPGGACGVLVFQLPTLPAGEQFASASASINIHDDIINSSMGIDLYGLPARAAPDVLATDYYQGSGYDPNATLIQSNFLTASTVLGIQPFSDASQAALLSYLNAQYADGAGAGQYVFLRFSPNADTISGWTSWTVLSEDAGGADEKPSLSYTAGPVPEPATLSLLVLGGLAVLRRRRNI